MNRYEEKLAREKKGREIRREKQKSNMRFKKGRTSKKKDERCE